MEPDVVFQMFEKTKFLSLNRDYFSAVKINSGLLFLFENGSLAGKYFWSYA